MTHIAIQEKLEGKAVVDGAGQQRTGPVDDRQ